MAQFMTLVSHRGEFPERLWEEPAPDPALFGLPTEDDGSRNDPMLSQSIITSTHYEPQWDRLSAASTNIVIAAGAESEG